MRKPLLLFYFILFLSTSFAQSFYYAQRAGNTHDDAAMAIVTDASDNVFVTGSFTDSIKFGTLPTLISGGSKDIFVVKYNASGAAQWSKRYGGTGSDAGTGIKVDGNGNIYLCGDHSGNITFDGITITTTTQNFFVVKLNSNVIAQWAITAGSSLSDDHAAGLGIDGNGNVYISGNFSGVASFGNGVSLTSQLHPLYQTYTIDIFITKYNSNGVCQWANKGSSYESDYSYGIATDNNGNSYITGFYGQVANFSGVTMPFQGTVDMFVAGYHSNGTLFMITSPPSIYGSSNYESGYGITLDASGQKIYVTGLFDGRLVFGSDTVYSSGSYDMFVVCYSTNGNPVWARDSYSTQWEQGHRVVVDADGNVYVGFELYHSGTPPFPWVTFNSAGYYDPVVVKYSSDGDFIWANRGGSTDYDYANGLALGDNGKLWLAGSFGNPATFGSFSLTHSGNFGTQDYYLVQLKSDLLTGTLTDLEYCGGDAIAIPFTTNLTFVAGNVFTAQLSNVNGSFTTPTNIGTLSGTTSGTVNATIPFNTPEGSGYRVRIISSDSVRNGGDNGANITIHGVPSVYIATNNDTVICSGDSTILAAVGANGISFQWYKDGALIPGATASDYHAMQTGSYSCVISNTYGCSFTSNSIHVTVHPTPTSTITAGSASSFCQGSSVTMNSNTNNNFTYQWKKNNVNISGATTPVYTANNSGAYAIVITNQYGCAQTSNTITVTVNPKPSATITAGGPVTFCNGTTVTLNGNTGTGLTYQWQRNNTSIPGAIASSYSAYQTGSYRVVVSNQYGCTKTSNSIPVTVNPKPAANVTASGPTTFCQGDSVTLNANTGGGLTYKWKLNGQNIAGATNASYKVYAAGSYSVQVTNQYGCKKVSAVTNVSVPCRNGESISTSQLEIYPNPASENIFIRVPDDLVPFKISVYNVIGQLVFESSFQAETVFDLDIKAWNSGTYLVAVQSNQSKTTSLFVKE